MNIHNSIQHMQDIILGTRDTMIKNETVPDLTKLTLNQKCYMYTSKDKVTQRNFKRENMLVTKDN